MAPGALSRVVVILILLGCAGFGGYGTFGAGSQNGLFEVISNSAGRPAASERYIPGGPEPIRTRYTGIVAIDDHVIVLVAFFTFLIDGPQTWDITLSYWYLMAHFCAGWTLMALEGLRKGNRGKLVSWTGIMGIVIQNVTYTVTVPLYLILHLVTSPVARPVLDPTGVLSVDPVDLILLPFTETLAFIIPAVMMSLPSPSVVSPLLHYGWDAFWQVFPVIQSVWLWALKKPLASPARTASTGNAHRQAAGCTYLFVLALSVTSQVALLAVATTPGTAVPERWAAVFSAVDLRSAFVPFWPWDTPTVDPKASPIARDGLARLARLFIQWDIYCAGTAILVWALYLHCIARPDVSSKNLIPKVAYWLLLGGPPAAAAVLLWERDEALNNANAAQKVD
ncbi:hypothetical protein NKR23_g3349 [Pleurostoma richardsiae]|uniref:Uncharacterized protein n=1 Tax=Pleurostoma richardsiae TaxID=41990 RepID=A0AA38RYL2_9PEZI|nr:hypothetical protein NKR23_g3349 [Pleurostoma richardsiae]